jgi:hypothetical protein
VDTIQNNTALQAGHTALYCYPPVGKDLTGSRVDHNLFQETFPVRVSLNQSTITDYGYYGDYGYLNSPGRVEVDWDQVTQPWWSVQVPLDLTKINSIAFSMECLANSFTFTVANLRFLPKGKTADDGAVTVNGSWYSNAGQGSVCALSASGPVTWGATGKSILGGWNTTGVSLPGGNTDLSPYRGLAFEISGTAVRKYDLNGCLDVDNGADPKPGRGAKLPASVGAEGSKTTQPNKTNQP